MKMPRQHVAHLAITAGNNDLEFFIGRDCGRFDWDSGVIVEHVQYSAINMAMSSRIVTLAECSVVDDLAGRACEDSHHYGSGLMDGG